MNDMAVVSGESLETRLTRLLRVYASRAGDPLPHDKAIVMGGAMAEGLQGRVSVDDLYELFDIAVEYRSVPDYRSCLRAMKSPDWDRYQRGKHEARRNAEQMPARSYGDTFNAIDPQDLPWVNRVERKLHSAPTQGEVKRWWSAVESLPPAARRALYIMQYCPYGDLREVVSRIGGHYEEWEKRGYSWYVDGRESAE